MRGASPRGFPPHDREKPATCRVLPRASTRREDLTRSPSAVDDPRELVSVGFVDLPVEELATGLERVAAAERRRHDRIAEVVESTVLTGIYEVLDDHDLSSTPRTWPTSGL